MTATEEKKLVNYINRLKRENEIMEKLSTRKGFYEYYFDLLKCSKTKYQAFNKVNKLFYKLFGKKRYDNFLVFSEMVKL